MKFSVGSVKYGYYGCGDAILKAYPNITNGEVRDSEFGKDLIVELNIAEDIIRFTDEVEHEVLIEGTLLDVGDEKMPNLLIYDDYMEME